MISCYQICKCQYFIWKFNRIAKRAKHYTHQRTHKLVQAIWLKIGWGVPNSPSEPRSKGAQLLRPRSVGELALAMAPIRPPMRSRARGRRRGRGRGAAGRGSTGAGRSAPPRRAATKAMRAAPPMRAKRAATKPVAVMKKAMKVSAARVVMTRRRPPMRKAVRTSPMKKDTAKVTPAKIHKRGVWYDALRCPELYDAAVASLKTNDLIEFEVMDRSGARLGNCISEVIGQRMSGDKGLPLVLISPPVAEEETVRSWMNPSLAAPNALHLRKAAARLVDVGSESYYIHKVERFRVRSPSSVVEDWALAVHERQPDPVPLQGYRPPARPAAVEPELPPPLQAGEAGRGAAMAAVDELGREFEGGAAAPLDGGGRREAPGLLPPRLPGLGLPRHEGLLGPGLPPSGMEPGPATPVSGAGIRAAWGEPLAQGFVAHAHEGQQRREPPTNSVRERLSLRIGRLHTIRTAKRLVSDRKATDALPAPDSDAEEFKVARHHAERERKRGRGRANEDSTKRKRRRKGTSSSSRSRRSPSSSGDSAEQLFAKPRPALPTRRGHRAMRVSGHMPSSWKASQG